MAKEQVDLRHFQSNQEFKLDEIQKRFAYLQSLGFSQEWIHALQKEKPYLYAPEVIDEKIFGLTVRGFHNPRKMIESFPKILSYGSENIDGKINGLSDRGFHNPRKMIESFPKILGYGFENIDEKINGLTERGFHNPLKMIESFLNILGYRFENIDGKINGLTERGFHNPHKMIESQPSIFNLAFENIDRKRTILDKLIRLYQLPLNPEALMEAQLNLFITKNDKLIVLAGVLRTIASSQDDVTNAVINRLLFANLEDVLLTVDKIDTTKNITISQFLRLVKDTKDEKLSKEVKRERITYGLKEYPKLRHRYFRGYPIK